MTHRAITITTALLGTLALVACSVSREASTTAGPTATQPAAPAELAAEPREDPDPYPGLELDYEADLSWYYSYEANGANARPVPREGLSFDEERVMGPDAQGQYTTGLDIVNHTSSTQDFSVWLEWKGAKTEASTRKVTAGSTTTFRLILEKGDAGDTAEWHVAAGDDPVIKISYQFPVKPVGT